jgi:2-methylisocitrate lyase-like PEP mutase family enzyme
MPRCRRAVTGCQEAPQTLEAVAAVPKRAHGPCLLNVVPGGRTPTFDRRDAQTMGYKLAILSGLMLKAAVETGDAALVDLKATQPGYAGSAIGAIAVEARSRCAT